MEKSATVRLKNRFDFRDFSGLKGQLTWYLDGKSIQTEPFKIKSIKPGETQMLNLSMPLELSNAPPNSRGLLLEAIQEKENSLLPARHVITFKGVGQFPDPMRLVTEKK